MEITVFCSSEKSTDLRLHYYFNYPCLLINLLELQQVYFKASLLMFSSGYSSGKQVPIKGFQNKNYVKLLQFCKINSIRALAKKTKGLIFIADKTG